MEIGLEVADSGKTADARRAARTSLARWQEQAATLGVRFVEPGGSTVVLRIHEPEAVVHPNALAAALASEGARVVPSRPSELFATLWEFDALVVGEGAVEPAPATLVRRLGPACVSARFLVHSFVGRRSHARPEVEALVPAGASRVLELGCAEGALGASLEARGARVTGIEMDEESASVAATRLSRVLAIPIETALPQLDEKFEVAVAADVLEHLDDPVSVLRLLREAATLLVFSVPNGSHVSVLAGVLQGRWDPSLEGIVAFDHRTYAGRIGWETLFCAAGWRVVEWCAVPLLPPRAAPWMAAFSLSGEDLTAYQWLGIARRSEPKGRLVLGPVPPIDEPPGGVTRSALVAARPLFRGEVAVDRAPLVGAVTRKRTSGPEPLPVGQATPPEEAIRARALGLPVAWDDLEAESWSTAPAVTGLTPGTR
jgi:SAM-dependent methyltransferase